MIPVFVINNIAFLASCCVGRAWMRLANYLVLFVVPGCVVSRRRRAPSPATASPPNSVTRKRNMRTFCLILVKPSHYDDDGYVIQWFRSAIPSNSLAALYGLARDCATREVLGPDVQLDIHPID